MGTPPQQKIAEPQVTAGLYQQFGIRQGAAIASKVAGSDGAALIGALKSVGGGSTRTGIPGNRLVVELVFAVCMRMLGQLAAPPTETSTSP